MTSQRFLLYVAMLALLYFYETTSEQKYLRAVDQLGNWVIANTWDSRGNGGFTAGYDGWENGAASGGSSMCPSGVFVNGQCKRLYKATEHNIDLYAAFSRLFAAEKLDQWAQAALHAKTFFLSMWDPAAGKFWTGTDEAGISLSTDVIPIDIQAWAIQALGGEAQPYLPALNYVEGHHKTTQGYGFKQNGGNQCGDNTWFEGTSQVAVANLFAGNHSRWQSILNNVHSGQLTSGAVPATDGVCLNTGFTLNNGQPWEYFPRAHVAATAWLSLAESGVNPFHPDLKPPDFSLSPATADLTLHYGAQETDVLTFVVQGGLSGSISLTCSVTGPSPLPTCALFPTSVTSGANPSTSTLTITAPGHSASLAPHLDGYRNLLMFAFWFLLPGLALLGIGLRSGKSKATRRTWWIMGGLALAFLAQQVGCAGITSTTQVMSAAQNYTVTVTGTSGSIQHSTTVMVTVQ